MPASKPTLAARLAGRPNIAAAWLFGSVARGDDHPDSDVDLGRLLTRPPRAIADHCELAVLAEELQAAIGRHVDLVARNDAHPELLHRVLRDGILLAESDHHHRVRLRGARPQRVLRHAADLDRLSPLGPGAPVMDQVIVEKHLVFLGEAVATLRQHGKPDVIDRDPVQFGFVVHRYLQVDMRVVRGILENHLDDLLRFARSVRDRLRAT